MLTQKFLQSLARSKMDDAILLYQHRRYGNSFYLFGYSAEIALKACIAGQFRANSLPDKRLVQDSYSHDVVKLVALAGLRPALIADRQGDLGLDSSWTVVEQWNEATRYERKDRLEAKAMHDAVTDPKIGVFQWIAMHW